MVITILRKIALALLFISFYLMASNFIEQLDSNLLLEKVSQTYDLDAKERIVQWLNFLQKNELEDEWHKVNAVNAYFNRRIRYALDEKAWGKKDYWATPIETLARATGDCEDYAIAKYFSLIALGIPEDKIRLMYVRQLRVNQPHMVLVYFAEKDQIPYVLDNFNPRLLLANKRRDLKPIYSFNGQGLWMAKAKGLGKKVNNSRGVSAWNKMLIRIEQGQLNTLDSMNQGNNYAQLH